MKKKDVLNQLKQTRADRKLDGNFIFKLTYKRRKKKEKKRIYKNDAEVFFISTLILKGNSKMHQIRETYLFSGEARRGQVKPVR